MYRFALCVYIFVCVNACAQVATRKVMTGEEVEKYWHDKQEIGDLYKRAAASRFVVVGTVSERQAVVEQGKPLGIDDNYAGTLYTVQIENTVCREADFDVSGELPPSSGLLQVVQLFVPLKPYVEGIQKKENLALGERYLLFLVVPEQKQLNSWSKLYGLDPNAVYYRGEELARGVILLPRATDEDAASKAPAVLNKISQLCQAMHFASPPDKINALNKLAASSDPILQKEAQEALNAIQAAGK